MAKHDQIVAMSRDGMAPTDIADKLETSKAYVYKVRSENKDEWSESDEGNDSQALGLGASEQPKSYESEDIEPKPDTPEDLTLEDSTEAKQYDCGGCSEPVEYLQKRCSNCGEQLMWSAIGEQ